MFAEYFCSKADSFVRSQSAIGINIQCQFIKVSYLTNTGIGYSHVYSFYRGIDGINSDYADRQVFALVLLCADISTSLGNGQFHVQLAFLAAA